MEKRQIVNIVNFIRGCEPRVPIDLYRPVSEQIRLMTKHGLRGTFLLQYNALIDERYTDRLRALDPAQFEIGVWLEFCREHVEAAGLPWRGRFDWDWHVHCGFSLGYTRAERVKLVDVLFARFKEIFGYYPRVLGSWIFDTESIRYASETYGLDALCNCKEEYGTDGYTLWGGYYGQGYYPSRENVFLPAASADSQLNVPLFRMLGSDPVYQYDFGLDLENGANTCQGVITLEPVYLGRGGGGDPAWVDWYFRENFSGECLSFGYTQVGQENSFGWEAMEAGLVDQFAKLAVLQKEGKLVVEPLGDTGRWYLSQYAVTPASVITAHSAYDDPEKKSFWYSSRFYRINWYIDGDVCRIRDIHLFREEQKDPFAYAICTTNDASYEALPYIDGNRHSGNGVLAGMYLYRANGERIACPDLHYGESDGEAVLHWGDVTIRLSDERMMITADTDFTLDTCRGTQEDHMPQMCVAAPDTLVMSYDGVEYRVILECGIFENADRLRSVHKRIILKLC